MTIERGQAWEGRDGGKEKAEPAATVALDEGRAPRTQFSAIGGIPPVAPLRDIGDVAPSASELAFGPSPVQMEPTVSKREIQENLRREKEQSSWKEKSQNATFNAMGTTLTLFARTLDKARSDLSFRLAIAKQAPKGSVEFKDALRSFNDKERSLTDQVFTIERQLKDIGYTAEQYPYLEDAVAALTQARDQLAPVMDDIDAWSGQERLTAGLIDWTTQLIDDIVPKKLLAPPKAHVQDDRDTTLLVYQNVSQHLDAAMTAAHSFASGNLSHEDRIVVHLNEIARWMPKPGDLGFPAFKTRVDTLARLLDQVVRDRPYAKPRIQEALQPIMGVR